MSEVTLSEVLSSRENRAKVQKDLIRKYKKPLISFTMNIAGPQKNSPLIERAFNIGIKRLYELIPKDKMIYHSKNSYNTGCEAFFSIDTDAVSLKSICESIEEESALGRLFDIDVINTDGNKLSRKAERNCIVCGAVGKACSAGRIHPVEVVKTATDKIMYNFFLERDKKALSDIAVESLIKEVKTTPKPGLVDSKNCGSHTDMNMDTFIKSANSLHSYFEECFLIGHKKSDSSPEVVFPVLKKSGLIAEETMYKATNGVNTHKGIIYSMGILCASVGILWTPDRPFKSIDEITCTASEISVSAIRSDFKNIDTKTAGGRLYNEYGIKGIRGEVLSGFLSIKNHSLPAFIHAQANGMSENDAGVLTLIKLISCVDDTNLYSRGGVFGAEFAKKYALSLLNEKSSDFIQDVCKMDDEFIKKNLSPGGCADLLAITYFLHDIKKYRD